MAETQQVPRNLNIEHIMPQGWFQRWPLPTYTDDEDMAIARRNRLLHSIGNLTLVNGRLNSTLSNAAWQNKRETLGHHSVMFLNKDLIQHSPSVWDETAIMERGRRLHQAAIQAWPHASASQ